MSARHYAAVILAAGLSSRMPQFKPLLPLAEGTVADHVIATFLNCGVDVFLVAGFRQDELMAGIKQRDITIVQNPEYQKGMLSSVQAGLRVLRPEHQGFFVMPVDIPLVREATVRRLRNAAAEQPEKIFYPVFQGKRGHPPLVPSDLAASILSWQGESGLKTFLASRDEMAREVPVADGNILFDIDVPADYPLLLERFRRIGLPSDEECECILSSICKVPPERIGHGRKVAEVAVALGKALNESGQSIDLELVRTAAVLHDIAKGQPKHDIAGGRMLQDMGFNKVGDVVAVHSDLAGGDTGLSIEAKIVFLADKFVKDKALVSIEERYEHPDWAPESRKAALVRMGVALLVKRELETLVHCPLEKIIVESRPAG
jgi:molybdenum cofactor cytidylyltransferase